MLERRIVGSAEARLLVERTARFVAQEHGFDLDEARSLGNEALVLAVRRFDVSRDVSFATFAAPRVRGHVLRALFKERRQHALEAEAMLQLREAGPMDKQTHEEEWAEARDTPEGHAVRLRPPRAKMPVEWVAPAGGATKPPPGARLIEHQERTRVFAALGEAIAALPEEERVVVELRLEGCTLEQMAARLGCGRATVARRRKRALDRLLAMLQARGVLALPPPGS